MFDNIAPAYDFMNTAMTFGLHRRWLRKALKALATRLPDGTAGDGMQILDLATGTGEVAFSLASMFPQAEITGADLSEGMLEVARKKLAEEPRLLPLAGRVKFQQGDCLDLKYAPESFDALTIAYGVRNLENLKRGFEEFYRVLRPGGSCMILELSRPENRFLRLGYDIYSRTLIPLAGRLVSSDRRAYSYLPESIVAMPPREKICEMLEQTGFRNVEFKSLTLGVVTYYLATK